MSIFDLDKRKWHWTCWNLKILKSFRKDIAEALFVIVHSNYFEIEDKTKIIGNVLPQKIHKNSVFFNFFIAQYLSKPFLHHFFSVSSIGEIVSCKILLKVTENYVR